jgi:Zn-dependent membrane protease YugP
MLPEEKREERVTSISSFRARGKREQALTVKDRIEVAFVSLVMLVLLVGMVTGATHVFHLGFAGWLAICLVISFAVITLNVVFNLSASQHQHFARREADAASKKPLLRESGKQRIL